MELMLDLGAIVADHAMAWRRFLAVLALIVIAGVALGVVDIILAAARARGRPHRVLYVRPATSTLFGGRWRPLLWRRAFAVHDGKDLLIYRLYSLTRPCLRVASASLNCAGHDGPACAINGRSALRPGPLAKLVRPGRWAWEWTECARFGTRWDWHRDHAEVACDSDQGRITLRVDYVSGPLVWGGVGPRLPEPVPAPTRGGR